MTRSITAWRPLKRFDDQDSTVSARIDEHGCVCVATGSAKVSIPPDVADQLILLLGAAKTLHKHVND